MAFASRFAFGSAPGSGARRIPATVLLVTVLVGCSGGESSGDDDDSNSSSGGSAGSATGGSSTGGSSTGGSAGLAGSAGTGATGGANGGSGGSAGSGAESGSSGGGASGSGGAGGTAGTGGAPGTLVTNPPGITFDVTGTPGIRVVSSNLTQDTSSSLVYVEWFLMVENTGTEAACQLSVDAVFSNAAGGTEQIFTSYAQADPHDGSISLSIPCIPPGKRGAFWSNDIPDVAIDLAGIRTAELDFATGPGGAEPHPLAPLVTSADVTEHSSLGAGYWSVSGSMTATGTIYNLGADVFFLSSAGLIVDLNSAFHLETFVQGTTWDFETIAAYEGERPSDFLLFTDFIEGAEMLELGLGARGTSETAAWTIRARDARALAEERRQLVRARRK